MAAVAVSVVLRLRAHGASWLDAIAIGGPIAMTIVGLAATLLAACGWFDPTGMIVMALPCAVAAWPRRTQAPVADDRGPTRLQLALLAGLVLGAMAVRWPVGDHALAGRDQGTYTLRARHTLQTGALTMHDRVLAGLESTDARAGPADIAGLYPKRGVSRHAGLYEAAYRPGWYLADRDRGLVVPQFLHLHPMLMACAGMVLGARRVTDVVLLEAALTLVALFAAARRLWTLGPWPWLAPVMLAISPLAIWVHRTALSENVAAMLLAGAAAALLRLRDDPERIPLAGPFLLGAVAWARGDAWAWVPLVLAATLLVPGGADGRRKGTLVYAGVVLLAVCTHAWTTFPYLHDELHRQLGWGSRHGPMAIVFAASLIVIVWLSTDELLVHRKPTPPWLRRVAAVAMPTLVGIALLGVAAWLVGRMGASAAPYSRLDPLVPTVGLPLLLTSATGAILVGARRWSPTSPSDAWLVALASTVAATVLLFAPRNLPSAGLYYYGRYLVPVVLPAAGLLATVTLRTLHAALVRHAGRVTAHLSCGALAVVALGWTPQVLVREPVTRMREFRGTARIVDALAERIPPDAVVIAGGEGWHHGHTFNQVGGALAVEHGRAVLPYRSREAAYATLYELLVAGPEHTDVPAPAVYLLLGEATHHLRRRGTDDPAPVAALDDLLPPPFVAHEIVGMELFSDRLTPVGDVLPTRVTRDELRMALMRIEVDPARRGETRWRWIDGAFAGDGAPAHRGGRATRDALCLHRDRDLILKWPAPGGPGSLVLVAAPGTSGHNHRWTVEIDGEIREVDMPHASRRARDTLGPFPVARTPEVVRIRGASKKVANAACPYGGLVEIRGLGPDAHALDHAPLQAVTFGPPHSLGHPVEPTGWVSGRGLSRYRAGIEPTPEVRGVSLVLTPDAELRFAPEPLPPHDEDPLDVVITLTAASVPPDARIELLADGVTVAVVDPPDDRRGSWQSEPIAWRPRSAVARLALRLSSSDPAAHVLVRDIGLFSRRVRVWSRVVDQHAALHSRPPMAKSVHRSTLGGAS